MKISTNADDGANSLARLINGVNITSNQQQMWNVGFNKTSPPFIYINFGDKQRISGFKLWNYNKSFEDSFSGVRKLEIMADMHKVTHEFIFIKKAPGRNNSDYSQFIQLPAHKSREISKETTAERSCLKQYSLPPRLPTGYSLKLRLMSTWGDSSYLGLNGIEIFDKKGKPVFSQPNLQFEIHADPEDVSILPGMERDVRKVSNLVDGVNLNNQDRNIWLAPFINPHVEGASNLGRDTNQIFIDFKEPVSIACIKFYNYSKNPERGVRSFEAYLDDYCIFSVPS
jgi:hypothetical protein